MRIELAKREGIVEIYRATFARYGRRILPNGGQNLTVLLFGLTDARGTFITDHLWFYEYKPFMPARLNPGDRIQFRAAAEPYQRKRDNEIDYRLARVSEVVKIR